MMANSPDPKPIAWNDVVRFIRQLSHDIRNGLNAAELQAAYLGEIVETDELKEEVKRLRAMIADVGGSFQRLTTSVAPVTPTLMPYRAADLVDDVKRKVATDKDDAKITWQQADLGEAMLNIDPQLLEQAFVELFVNAARHQPGQTPPVAEAQIDNDRFVFHLRESKTGFEQSVENWGREPLRNVGRDHYGLGLNRVRAIIAVHGGDFNAEYDPAASVLVTTVVLPLAKQNPG